MRKIGKKMIEMPTMASLIKMTQEVGCTFALNFTYGFCLYDLTNGALDDFILKTYDWPKIMKYLSKAADPETETIEYEDVLWTERPNASIGQVLMNYLDTAVVPNLDTDDHEDTDEEVVDMLKTIKVNFNLDYDQIIYPTALSFWHDIVDNTHTAEFLTYLAANYDKKPQASSFNEDDLDLETTFEHIKENDVLILLNNAYEDFTDRPIITTDSDESTVSSKSSTTTSESDGLISVDELPTDSEDDTDVKNTQ
jgi:hypothetical protein